MNRYFILPNLEFDSKELLFCYNRTKSTWAKYGKGELTSLYTQYVDLDCNGIQNIINQFVNPELIENIKFFKTPARGSVTAHCDKRNVAINIPVQTDDLSYTLFYEDSNDFYSPQIEVKGKTSITKAKKIKNAVSFDHLVLNQVICLNTSLPHGVENNSDKDRVILSISFKEKYDQFNTIKTLYENNNLLKTHVK